MLCWRFKITTDEKRLPQNFLVTSKNSRSEVFCKKVLRRISQNSPENTCATVLFNKVGVSQVFSCEFCEFSRNTVPYRTSLVATSELFKCVFRNAYSDIQKILSVLLWKSQKSNCLDFFRFYIYLTNFLP